MKRILYIIYILLALTACTDHELEEVGADIAGNKIVVGATTSPLDISVSEAPTRAKQVQDAEEVEWLIPELKKGLDITYGKVSNVITDRNEHVAMLKLTGGSSNDLVYAQDPDTQWAIYSFKYKGTEEDAIWYDNGEHYFEGMFVPDNLRYGSGLTNATNRTELSSVNTTSAPNITTDQSGATNYSYLEHYLAMPANTKIHATIGRVKLPFYHRLSRVIAYILIDPDMQTDPAHPVTLKGYKKDASGNATATEDPATTSLRFCNVEVLTGVQDLPPSDSQHTHELTPKWRSIRKVIPHFEAEEGSMVQNATGNFVEQDANFYMFYDDNTQEYIFPTMEKWATYYENYKNASEATLKAAKVTRTNYGKVPVYDLIVRPTYTEENSVMYDERNDNGAVLSDDEKAALVEHKNKIDFELTLSNELIYTKEFEFDLNANEQTVIYLRISRESVDYNASGSDIWIKKVSEDDWYGVDNREHHSLSKAGSSWQRAYTYSATVSNDKVTDGGFYNETTTGEDGTVGQYVTKETWIKKFAQAHQEGACHGDYFILTNDITIDATSLPDNFVFTGHLDAHGHTITLTGTNQDWTDYVATTEYSSWPLYSQSGTVYSLPMLYTKTHHEAEKYSPEDLTEVDDKTYVTSTLTPINYTEAEIEEAKAKINAEGYEPGSDLEAEAVAIKTTNDRKSWDTTGATVATIEDIKREAYDTYHEATGLSVATMMTSGITYYERSGAEDPFTYTEYTKPEKLYRPENRHSGSALFAGLNGAYSATDGVANVHSEGGYLVPYTDGTTGWRAEVMNLKVIGAMFPESVYTLDAENHRTGYVTYPARRVSGNVDNCYDGATGGYKVPNHTPALFRYN